MNPSILLILALIMPLAAKADVDLAWSRAPVYLPGQSQPTMPADANPKGRLPVVIYLHGCGGIDPRHDRPWARFLADNGYAVIMPDSMARPGRVSVCDPLTRSWNMSRFPQVYGYRQQEIEHSLEQVRRLPWVNPDQIFLMGHSEGGYAASLAGLEGFRSIIISGWQCGAGMAIRVPPNTGILNLTFTRDPWYHGTFREGRCRDFDQRVEEVVLDQAVHETYPYIQMRQAVINHLRRQK